MILRDFKPSDFGVVELIYNAAKKDELSYEQDRFDVIPLSLDRLRLTRFHNAKTCVCEINGEVVGFLSHEDGYLSFLFVSEKHRRVGVAAVLLKSFLIKNFDRSYLSVVSSNIPALQFYLKYGFKTESKSVVKYQGKDVTVDIMLYSKS